MRPRRRGASSARAPWAGPRSALLTGAQDRPRAAPSPPPRPFPVASSALPGGLAPMTSDVQRAEPRRACEAGRPSLSSDLKKPSNFSLGEAARRRALGPNPARAGSTGSSPEARGTAPGVACPGNGPSSPEANGKIQTPGRTSSAKGSRGRLRPDGTPTGPLASPFVTHRGPFQKDARERQRREDKVPEAVPWMEAKISAAFRGNERENLQSSSLPRTIVTTHR